MRPPSTSQLPSSQAPTAVVHEEHEGEALPWCFKPGMGERFPRLTLILDDQAIRDLESVDDATLGQLVRLGVFQACEPEVPWLEAVGHACTYVEQDIRSLRVHLRRFSKE